MLEVNNVHHLSRIRDICKSTFSKQRTAIVDSRSKLIIITHLLFKSFQQKTLFWRIATIKVFNKIISLQLDSLFVLTGICPNPLTKYNFIHDRERDSILVWCGSLSGKQDLKNYLTAPCINVCFSCYAYSSFVTHQ